MAFGDNVDITYCNYDDIDKKVKNFIDSGVEAECHITDISIDEKLAERINEEGLNFHLLDHHPTALNLNKFDWCQVETEVAGIKTSGTELYYYWLTNNGLGYNHTYRKFAEMVRDYDTWRWANLGEYGLSCKKFNDLFHMYGREKFIDWCLDGITEDFSPMFTEQDEFLLDMKQKEIDDYIALKNKELIIHDLCGHTCGFVFAERFLSELGNKLCKLHPEIDFVAMIDVANNTVSYRTIRDDIDLGKDVAKLFGGGGHPKAAGSQFDSNLKLEFIKNIFNRDEK